MDSKIVEKLAKLKAMADGAKAIGSEAEAQAFAEMLNRLLTKHKLEMTDIEFERMERDEPVGMYPVNYAAHGIPVTSKRCAWSEKLAHIVMNAHFCKFAVRTGSSSITIIGRKTDAEVAEYMFVTLQRSLRTISENATADYRYNMLQKTGIAKTYGFRASFIDAFLNRLLERFNELRREQTSSMALVRINKAEKAVKDFLTYGGFRNVAGRRGQRTGNVDGERSGRSAADKVNLSANALNRGGSGANKLLD